MGVGITISVKVVVGVSTPSLWSGRVGILNSLEKVELGMPTPSL